MSFFELLGDECSEVGYVRMGGSEAAYVRYRGMTLAALGADRPAALAALRGKIEEHLPALRDAREIAVVEEVNLVLERQGAAPRRVFARPMSLERALLELDMGIDGALVFVEEGTRNFAILSRAVDGEPQLVRIGDPVRGDDSAARPLPVPDRTPATAEEERLLAEKAARIRPLLRCPTCRDQLEDLAAPGGGKSSVGLRCAACGREFPGYRGKYVLPVDPAYDPAPRGTPESQNPYGAQVLELIEKHRDGWVLDMGSGSPSRGFYNVVHLELSGYDQVDVVTDGRAVPFADDTFDAVLSEAVLEHVPDPEAYLAELARVLKPGGTARVDVAFLQPFHGYPDHYFNMTSSGLRTVVEGAGLEVVALDVGEHQMPFIALGYLLSGFVNGTPDPDKRQKLLEMPIGEALSRIEKGGGELFRSLTPEAIERLAAGYWCLARKPED